MVPAGCSHFSIRYDLKKEAAFLVFLLLKDPNGEICFQKQLGYGEPVIQIGSKGTDTTIGGVPGSVVSGEWTLEIRVFAKYLDQVLGEEEIPVLFTICDKKAEIQESVGEDVWTDGDFTYVNYDWNKIYSGSPGWYKGDWHTHTRLSDGKETTENATRKAGLMKLDYYVPTEHNVIHTGWKAGELLILPGVEITTEAGHANIFGIDRMPQDLISNVSHLTVEEGCEDLRRASLEAKRYNWVYSLNHPFLHIWKWEYRDMPLCDIDCLEIVNDPTYQYAGEANERAIRLLDLLWQDGYRITGIGGSDSHNTIEERYPGATEPSIAGDPATWAYVEELTPKRLLEAIRKGHCYVSRRCRADIFIRGEKRNYLPGDEIRDEAEVEVELAICDLMEKPVVYVLEDGKKRELPVTFLKEDRTYRARTGVAWEDGRYHWFRIGAEGRDGGFLLYTNPLYRGRKEHRFLTYGDILQEMNQYGD